MAECKECEAEIRWIEMESGKMMPVEEDSRGLVVKQPDGRGKLIFGFEPHWQNCPAAKLFKGKKRGKHGLETI